MSSLQILGNGQKYIKAKTGSSEDKPVFFVFHGGSGSSRAEIREAIDYGVVKMNIDTDTQWAYWDGVRQYEAKNRAYLQGQVREGEGLAQQPYDGVHIDACFPTPRSLFLFLSPL